jgi:GWxTD domain-containing protein
MKKILMCLLLLTVSLAFADQYDKWVDETVKVLITKEERDAFKKLKTNEEKDKFMADFWAKRDPSPGTPENEFKTEYETRMKTVSEKISGGQKKPMDTDMGKAVLLLGNPSDSKKEEGDPPKQTWSWSGLPKEMGVGDPQIKFVGDEEQGGFKFADPKAANDTLDKARTYFAKLSTVATAQAPAAAPQAKPSTVAHPQAVAVTTPELKTALDAAAAGTAGKDFTADVLGDSFMTSEGQTFATVALKSDAPKTAKVGVRIVDASGNTVTETELPFASAKEKQGFFETALPVPAGEYSLVVAATDGGKSTGAKMPLSVPDYGSKLSISSPIFVGEFQQLTEGEPEMSPYTFGKTKIVPSFDHSFPKGGDLKFLYEIYNAQNDPATGKSNLEETVRFDKQGGGNPKQSKPAPPQGFAIGKKITVPTGFPLGTFEPGEYKLTLTITDKTNGQTATKETMFKVQ